MVSLEDKLTYIERIKQNSSKLRAFHNLLSGTNSSFLSSEQYNEADELFFGIITSIQANDKKTFEHFYSKKSKANPSKDSLSPFINDDFLIFCLIIGIIKFELDRSWIKNIIQIRSQNDITYTFGSILNENFQSKNALPEILLMFFQLTGPISISEELLNAAFEHVSDDTTLFQGKSDFKIICAVKSYDLAVLRKTASDENEIRLLKQFNQEFLKRIKKLSWFIQTVIIVTLLYGIVELISTNPGVKSFFDKFSSALKMLGLVGISQIGNIFPFVKSRLYGFWLRVFGYPKSLTAEVIKKEAK